MMEQSSLPLSANNLLTTLSEKQILYRKVFVQEFFREFYFLSDVIRKRAKPKGDFTDKLVKALTAATGGALKALSAPTIVATIIETATDLLNEQRKLQQIEHIGNLCDEVDPVALQMLLEQTAHIASHRYADFMDNYLSGNPVTGVIPFAVTGVERSLEYIARHSLNLSIETLLQALIEGRSGKYVAGPKNTPLTGKQKEQGKLTAEGAYGRAALRTQTPTGWKLWRLDDKEKRKVKDEPAPEVDIEALKSTLKKITEDCQVKDTDTPAIKTKKAFAFLYKESTAFPKWVAGLGVDQLKHLRQIHSHYGYSKKLKNSDQPKYGYMDVTATHAKHYGYNLTSSMTQLPNSSDQCPQTCTVTANDIKAYMQQVQEETTKKIDIPSFKTFIKTRYHYPASYPETSLAIYVTNLSALKEKDKTLAKGDFSGVYFLGVNLSGFDLTETKFRGAYLWYNNLSKANAENADFYEAQMQGVIAKGKGTNFKGANLCHAQLQFADFEEANLTSIEERGANWSRAKLINIHDENVVNGVSVLIKQLEKNRHDCEEYTKSIRQQVEKEMAEIKSEVFGLKTAVANISKLEKEQSEFEKALLELRQQQQSYEVFKRYSEQEIALLKQQQTENVERNKQQLAALQAQQKIVQQQFKDDYQAFIQRFENELIELRQQFQQQLSDLATRTTQLEKKVMEEKPKQTPERKTKFVNKPPEGGTLTIGKKYETPDEIKIYKGEGRPEFPVAPNTPKTMQFFADVTFETQANRIDDLYSTEGPITLVERPTKTNPQELTEKEKQQRAKERHKQLNDSDDEMEEDKAKYSP